MSGTLLHEKQVEQLVINNERQTAVQMLYDLIVQEAKARNFTKAEYLRNRIMEIDDMAISKIIRSGEIIEEEKANAMDPKHVSLWSALYSTLTKEQSLAFYFELQNGKYDENLVIFEEGKLNNKLYLIESGELKMIYRQGDKEMLLKNLGRGDIAGEDTFFSVSYCTTSLITLSMADLKFIEKESLIKLEKNHPGISKKIQEYCSKTKQVIDLLEAKNLERRIHKRYNLKEKVRFRIINNNGKGISNTHIGLISDISAGGLSFLFKISNKETPQLLLGKRINLKFSLPQDDFARKVNLNGTVLGVCNHFFNDFSIHVKFDEKITEDVFAKINQ